MSDFSMNGQIMYHRLLARLRMRHLHLLVAISEHGNLHAAAESVGFTQPSATHAVREIERLLGVELFDRYSRGVQANALGQLLIDYAHASLRSLERVTEKLGSMQATGAIQLQVGVIKAASTLLCRVLPTFSTRHPEIGIQVIEDSNRDLIQMLLSGELEMVLCRQLRETPADVEKVDLLLDHAVMVASPGHPLVELSNVSMEQLYRYPWIVAPEGTECRTLFMQLVSVYGQPTLAPVCSTSMPLVAEILKDRHSIALLPKSLADDMIQRDLVTVLSTNADTQLPSALPPLSLYYLGSNHSPAVKYLCHALNEDKQGEHQQGK